jgi:hypothetical protein
MIVTKMAGSTGSPFSSTSAKWEAGHGLRLTERDFSVAA